MQALCLPLVSTELLPTSFNLNTLNINTSVDSLVEAKNILAQQQKPDYIAFSTQTPILLLLAAQQCWPNALYLLQQKQGWLELSSGEYLPVQKTATPPKDEATPPVEKSQIPSASNIATQPSISPKDEQLLFDIFKYAAWGQNEPSNYAQIEAIFAEITRQGEQKPDLLLEAQKKRNLGTQAYNKWIGCERRLKKGGDTPEFKEWFTQQTQNTNHLVAKYLKNKLYRWQSWRNSKQQQFAATDTCQLAPVTVIDTHPNSLRHLTPHHHWQILIDETGSEFNNSKHLSISDKTLGRMVALAIPVGKVSLPALKKDFHAINESNTILDTTIQNLLSNPVGIVGITVNDDLLGKSSRWFSGIYMLMRLVLRLLPIPSEKCTIEFFIEQRGGFDEKVSLLPIQQLLESDLQGLDNERFKHVSLLLQFANKNHHPANGYVDALAHMWAQGSPSSKKRLKSSALKGHCLLEPQHDVIERSYVALDQKLNLNAKDWYLLVSAISHEPSSSLLHSVLQQLGTHTQQQTQVWNSYLDYVNQLLKDKNYRLLEIKSALDWLALYRPQTLTLPPMLTLHWYMARLACANHLGQNDLDLFEKSLSLGSQLLEENAPEVCHLHLRIAVAATNLFEFDAAQHILDFWKDQPARVMGLSNYGKYLSSLGQIAAFKGNLNQAITYFEQALAAFDKLSDAKEKHKQQQQTQIYRLIALMDMPQHSDNDIKMQLEQFFGTSLDQAAHTLSRSDDSTRFEQHLLVRAMIQRPALLQTSYVNSAEYWQSENTHPWSLICAYRAIILHQQEQPNKAILWMQKAISLCQNSDGATLQWMGEVLTAFAQKHKLAVSSSVNLSQLKSNLPHAPWTALQLLQQANTQSESYEALARCLPFNFH